MSVEKSFDLDRLGLRGQVADQVAENARELPFNVRQDRVELRPQIGNDFFGRHLAAWA